MDRTPRLIALGLTAASIAVVLASGPAHGSGTLDIHRIATDGHPTHPVWYHDDPVVRSGHHLVFAWNSNAGSVQVRTWNLRSASWSTSPITVSKATLDCSCTDSTGTNPNRHDVPTVFTDPVGRVYVVYGGGTASHTGPKTGPYFRAASSPGVPKSWKVEQRLSIAGAMYDIEAVRDNLGVNHLIGQQGDNSKGAGSLLSVQVPPGSSTTPAMPDPAQRLVRGGFDPSACSWQATPGCNIYVIGRIAVGAADPTQPTTPEALFLTWGWSEKNLSGTCGDPAGFCNHGLYFAQSFDEGNHWLNASGSASVDVGSSPIAYDDPRFEVIAPTTDVGLYKAIAATGAYPGAPVLVYQSDADLGTGVIDATSWNGSSWTAPMVVDATRGWNNHLVFRAYADGRLGLWSDIAQTGGHATDIERWTLPAGGGSWAATLLLVGANWFLTGRAAGSSEVLVWRAPGTTGATKVRFVIVGEP